MLRFGRFCLDPRNRVLLRGEAIVPLSPKTLDLLLYLVSNRGRVNTRSELMEALWPGVFVEEGSLAFQISSLRKALGEEGSPWIETVPKVGYRFTAPVDADQPAHPTASAKNPEDDPKKLEAEPRLGLVFRPSFLQIAGLTACLALVLVGGFSPRWSSTGTARGGDILAPVIPVTTFPGYESDPSLSPDGSQIAFSWTGPDGNNRDLYVKVVGAGEPIRITAGPEDDVSPQWSPDGRHIAYVRRIEGHSSVMIVPSLGGAPRRLTNGPIWGFRHGAAPVHFLAWTPDSRRLIVPCAAAGQGASSQSGLALIDIDSPEKVTRLTLPLAQNSGDWAPALSADGRRLAFVRVEEYRSHAIMIQTLGSSYTPTGSPVTLLQRAAPLGGLSWTVDDHSLVYSAGGDIGVRYLELLPINGTTAKPPVMLGEGEQATTTAARGDRLVYTKVVHDSNIWSYPIDPVTVRLIGPPKRLAASSREDYQGELSPDGRTLVFVSSRSGFSEIWIANADGSFPRQMTRTQGPRQRDHTGRRMAAKSCTTLNPRDGVFSMYWIHQREKPNGCHKGQTLSVARAAGPLTGSGSILRALIRAASTSVEPRRKVARRYTSPVSEAVLPSYRRTASGFTMRNPRVLQPQSGKSMRTGVETNNSLSQASHMPTTSSSRNAGSISLASNPEKTEAKARD